MSEPNGYPRFPEDFTFISSTGRHIRLSPAAVAGTELMSISTNGLAPGTVASITSGNLVAASCDNLTSNVIGIVESENVLRLNGIHATAVIPGAIYYLGIDGAMSLTPPTENGYVVVRVGVGLPTGLKIQIQEICIL